MTKPHLSPLIGEFFTWSCAGQGVIGYGMSQAEAYRSWDLWRKSASPVDRSPTADALRLVQCAAAKLGDDHAAILPVRQAIRALQVTIASSPADIKATIDWA